MECASAEGRKRGVPIAVPRRDDCCAPKACLESVKKVLTDRSYGLSPTFSAADRANGLDQMDGIGLDGRRRTNWSTLSRMLAFATVGFVPALAVQSCLSRPMLRSW